MAKKAVKKEAPAAKGKKVAKAPVKSAAKSATKSPVKAKPVAKAPAKAAKPAAKPVKAAAPAAKVANKKVAKPAPEPKKSAPAVKPVAVEKPVAAPKGKIEKAPKIGAPETIVEEVVSKEVVPLKKEKKDKKEKKVKLDKSGFTEDQAKWHELHEKYKTLKAPSYTISGQFEAKTPVVHKIFGWGFIVSNEYDRLEVLFEDGKRMLISNRQL